MSDGSEIQFSDEANNDAPYMDVSYNPKQGVFFSTAGNRYQGDYGWERDSAEMTLDLKDVKALRDYLDEVLEAEEHKRIQASHLRLIELNKIKLGKPRVYKRDVSGLAETEWFDKDGFVKTRPWTCTGVPEDTRKTCYKTWEDAMEWATMSSEKRIERIEYDAQFEMGQ
jgi:hypothetical protein